MPSGSSHGGGEEEEATINLPASSRPSSSSPAEPRDRQSREPPGTMSSVVVRPCARRDLRDIMRLIKDIAVIYNVPLESLSTNVQALEEAGFGPRPKFECFVAEIPPERKSPEGFTLAGYVLSSYTYNSWKGKNLYIDNFYVMPEFRGMRIGNSLLKETAKAAWEQGCSELRMHVSHLKPENVAYLERRGGENLTAQDGWNLFRFYQDRLSQMANQSRV